MRQIVLDTETTGLDPAQGHRIIEIGCVELVNRKLTGRHFHHYLQPDRQVDPGAFNVHGISNEFLADKLRFHNIVEDFLAFVEGAELIIHNAPFDVGFINAEFKLLPTTSQQLEKCCTIVDTLILARQMHPGQRNSLDALCKRYEIDNSHRESHGALLDAKILADVYLAMTGGQASLILEGVEQGHAVEEIIRRLVDRPGLRVIRADEQELDAHAKRLAAINKESGGKCVWTSHEQVTPSRVES